ncbi:MAG: leucine-rich repeat protein, partial [Ilumatobacteraceae bacterium]
MSQPVAALTSTQRGMSARAKRHRLAIALALVLGTVTAGASSAPHSAHALDSGGLVFGPFQGSNESWEVTGCAAVCADPVIIPSVVDGKPVFGIGQSSFWYDSSLREVRIPASITTISSYAFGGSSATTFVVDPLSQHFTSVNGMLMTIDGTELVAYPGGATATSVTVPTGVMKIRAGAFFGGPVTSVSLPTSLEVIEQQAFYLNGLLTLELPSAVSSIGEDAFGPSLTAITVAAGNPTFSAVDGVLFRGNELFMYPRGRTATSYQVPAGTTAIQDTALDRNPILTSISLPVSLTTFTSNPLRGLSALSSVSVVAGHPTLSAVDGVLFRGSSLIAYPKARAGATYSVPSGTTE